jgi:hypothetical protein
MTINISPLDQQVHLKQYEPKFGDSIYDHSNQPLTGWRAERQHVENSSVASHDQSKPVAGKNETAVGKNWIAKIVNLFVIPRFAS